VDFLEISLTLRTIGRSLMVAAPVQAMELPVL
jgi:hypothetical protein